MIKNVTVLEGIESPDQIAEIKTIYDNGEIRYDNKMIVKRGYGEGKSTNVNGTDEKIEICGDFMFVESESGSGEMELTDISKQDIKDAVAVFRAIFGNKMNE